LFINTAVYECAWKNSDNEDRVAEENIHYSYTVYAINYSNLWLSVGFSLTDFESVKGCNQGFS